MVAILGGQPRPSNPSMPLSALPAFQDNYIWVLSAPGAGSVVVDPGEPGPVLAAAAQGLVPALLLLTHHHADHIGGAAALLAHWPGLPVFAPQDPRIDLPCTRVADGDTVAVMASCSAATPSSAWAAVACSRARPRRCCTRSTGWPRSPATPASAAATSTPWPMPLSRQP